MSTLVQPGFMCSNGSFSGSRGGASLPGSGVASFFGAAGSSSTDVALTLYRAGKLLNKMSTQRKQELNNDQCLYLKRVVIQRAGH